MGVHTQVWEEVYTLVCKGWGEGGAAEDDTGRPALPRSSFLFLVSS